MATPQRVDNVCLYSIAVTFSGRVLLSECLCIRLCLLDTF